ncbi:hypothetical protein AGMMS50233_09410 [Endomicrobiia bacterium]|nr:hypothetical protein AGMMS50233_09410 [Endomicrobiia bacterium]
MTNKKDGIVSVTTNARTPKGIEKATATQIVMETFYALGGKEGFAQWAKRNPDIFYTKLFHKLVPQAVELSGAADNERPINIHLPAEAAKI